ncbi:MAG: hypothetical protein ACLPWF_07520 [Bryobacteraceae bacterium]
MIGGLPGDSFVFGEFQEGGGTFELALLLATALVLDFAEHVQGFLKLAGEPLGVDAEGGEGAVGVDDVEIDSGLIGGWVGGAVEEGGFQQGDAVEAPGCIGEFLSELGLSWRGGLVFVEELAAVELVGGGVLSSEDGGAAGEAVAEGILGRTLFAGGGAGSGGEKRIRAVGASTGVGRAVRDWGWNRVCHERCLRCGLNMDGWRFCA